MWIEVKNQNQGNYPGVSNVNLLDLATGNTIYPYKNEVIYAFGGAHQEEPFNTEPEALARYEEIKGMLINPILNKEDREIIKHILDHAIRTTPFTDVYVNKVLEVIKKMGVSE